MANTGQSLGITYVLIQASQQVTISACETSRSTPARWSNPTSTRRRSSYPGAGGRPDTIRAFCRLVSLAHPGAQTR